MHARQLHADLETPVSAYIKLSAEADTAFLLESVEGRERWASYSIIGIGARRRFVVRDGAMTVETGATQKVAPVSDALSALRQQLKASGWTPIPDAPHFVGGIFGFLAYDAVRRFEHLPPPTATPAEVPDAYFVEPELLAVFDNRRHSLALFGESEALLDAAAKRLAAPLPPARPPKPFVEPTSIDSRESFAHNVALAKEHIACGDIIQVVLSRRFEMPHLAGSFDVYRGLRTINPSPYLYYFKLPELAIAGASPEVMVRVEKGRMVVRPIAGTRRRGESSEDDDRLAEELVGDPKERAEHIMLVDLGRNDVGRVCAPGSVRVESLLTVEMYSHVMHLVSEVQGTLAPGHDAFDALCAAFPAGTLSGAPKVRAMQIIDDLERRRRGIYGGAVGYFGPGGDADFGIAIRTLVAFPERFVIQAGAGIVADSDPQSECDETEHKARAVVRAVRWACERAHR